MVEELKEEGGEEEEGVACKMGEGEEGEVGGERLDKQEIHKGGSKIQGEHILFEEVEEGEEGEEDA